MTTTPRVLVVDDDPDVQQTLADLLAHDGYEVEVATNGADAISVLETGDAPCAMLVDLLMPGVVGGELLEYVRHEARLAKMPVAIVSGSPHLAPEGYTVITKPISARVILDFVRGRC